MPVPLSLQAEKERHLEDWRKRKRRRRAWALKVMKGERSLDQLRHQWQRFDIMAEIALIEQEREEGRRAAERVKRERAAREAAKEAMHADQS